MALAQINTIQLANATPAAKSLPLPPLPPRLTALPKINPAPNVNIGNEMFGVLYFITPRNSHR
jgi:hypothetical protein